MRALLLAVAFFGLAAPARAQPRPLPAEDGLPSRWPRRPMLDLARAELGVDVAWERFGLAGRGATVCVVDTGVDLTHADFIDAEGHTRVDWLLDLDAAPSGAWPDLEDRFGGRVLDHEALDAMLTARDPALPGDWHGHGTAMASAAVGDDAILGATTPGLHAGVAPLARLVVVRAMRRGMGGFADADIVRGVSFCEAVVDPSRTVALLSLGGHDGLHDGTEPLEVALARLVHRGLAIVVAAGNDSGRAFHAAGRVAEGAVERVAIRLPTPGTPHDAAVVLAVRGASSVALVAPDGTRTPDSATAAHTITRTSSAVLSIDATRGGVIDVAIVGDDETRLAAGEYGLEIRGPARFDAWIVHESLAASLGRATLVGRSVVSGDEVAIPATSDAVIAVGSSVSRSFLARADGGPGLTLDADGEGRAVFSAVGPSAVGSARPDVLAPGGWIVAALSSQIAVGDTENLFRGDEADLARHRQDEHHFAVAGTSVSAALVAGVLALAFESGPSQPMRERSLLALTATRSEALFTPRRGFGVVDVPAFLAARVAPTSPITGLSLGATRAFVTPGATDLGLVAIVTAGGDAVPEDGWVSFAREGEPIARAPLVAGIARARVPLGVSVPGRSVSFSATIASASADLLVPVRFDEDGSLAEPRGAGACAVAGAGDGTRTARSSIALVLAVVLVYARRARRLGASQFTGQS